MHEHGGPRTCTRARTRRSTAGRGRGRGGSTARTGGIIGAPGRSWDASLSSGAVAKHVEACIPPMGGGDKARGGGHGCRGMDAPPPMGAVTDAGAWVNPSHGRRSRMHVHGCTRPMGDGHGCACTGAPLSWGRSRMHVHGCTPPMGAVTDARAWMPPSHGRRSRMSVHGCPVPWEAVTDERAWMPPSHGRRSRMSVHGCPRPMGGGPEARRGTHSSRMRGRDARWGDHPSRMSTRLLPPMLRAR